MVEAIIIEFLDSNHHEKQKYKTNLDLISLNIYYYIIESHYLSFNNYSAI